MINDSILRQIRQEWADFLEAIPYFADLNILLEDKEDFQNEAQRALGPDKVSDAGKVGILIVLMTVTAKPSETGEFGPIFEDIKMMARVYENVQVNRYGTNGTGKTYEGVAEKIYGYSQGLQLPSARGPLVATDPGIVLGNDPDWPCKDVFMSTIGSLAIVLDQAAAPNIINNAGVLTMTCDTPGAAIFYTLDNRKPNPRSLLYTAPVAVAPGILVRARAWLSGFLASEITPTQL